MLDDQSLRRLRAEFPILNQRVNGQPLVYFDNAATTQKPRAVIDAVNQLYRRYNANVHRSAHQLAYEATEAYEQARTTVARYLGVPRSELVWTSGATESINLAAAGLAGRFQPGDRIILARSNHHANIVPWQQLCRLTGAQLDILELQADGELDLELYQRLLEKAPKLVAISHASNVLGTIYPVEQLVAGARSAGALTLIDAAQALPHFEPAPHTLGADLFVFSGHKLFGPTGIGGLWARAELLEEMPPWKTGGEMIERVSFETTQFAKPPQKFEAGTPNIAGAIGLAAAIEFLEKQDRAALAGHEQALLEQLLAGLETIPGLQVLAAGHKRVSLVSLEHNTQHAQDLASALDQRGFATRAGTHCAQPLLAKLGVESALRASLAFYNTPAEVDRFVQSLAELVAPTQITIGADSKTLVDQIINAKSWPERYTALLELGGLHTPVAADLRSPEWEVHGCETRVWMRLSLTEQGHVKLEADAQAKALKGLLGLISARLEQIPVGELELSELKNWLIELGFERNLSRTRGNAVVTLLDRLETLLTEARAL